MSKSARLRQDDLHTLNRLIHDCRDVGDDAMQWQSLFAEQIGRLAGAALVFAGEAGMVDDNFTMLSAGDWGWHHGFDARVLASLQVEYGDIRFHPMVKAYFARPEQADGRVFDRKDLVRDADWNRSLYLPAVHETMGIGPNIVCFLGKMESCRTVMMCRQARDRREFSPREKMLVQAANALIAPFVGGPLAHWKEPSPSELPLRAREVLQALLEGDSDKQTATRLGISRFTVNQYTKVIFKHFGVGTRSELLARWVKRGWGAKCAWVPQREAVRSITR